MFLSDRHNGRLGDIKGYKLPIRGVSINSISGQLGYENMV